MATGIIKYLNEQKGFAFVERDGASDVFLHCRALEGIPWSTNLIGEQVEFEVDDVADSRGPCARHARLIADP